MSTDARPAGNAEEMASAWFARQRCGNLSESDQRAWALWLAADPSHQRAYEDVSRTWTQFAILRADPGIMALRKQALQRRRWTMPGIAASLAASVMLFFVCRPLWPPASHLYSQASARIANVDNWESLAREEYRTNIGEQRTVRLVDGSAMTLDTQSVARVALSRDFRLVRLVRGQAFFSVAKDRSRPFIVLAGHERVMAVGTAFDVRLEGDELSVTLREGRVRIEAPRQQALPADPPGQVLAADLVPGTKLQTSQRAGWQLAKADVTRELSWLHRQIVVDSERLEVVVAEMNRYSSIKIVLGDPALASVRVGGVFAVDNPDKLTGALARYGLVRVASRTATSITLMPP